MGKGEPRIVPVDWKNWMKADGVLKGMRSLSMIWCDNLGETNTWEKRIEKATEYFRNKYGEPAAVIVPLGAKVKDGNGLPVFEAGYCPTDHLIVCMKRIDDEKQTIR